MARKFAMESCKRDVNAAKMFGLDFENHDNVFFIQDENKKTKGGTCHSTWAKRDDVEAWPHEWVAIDAT